MSTPIRSKRIKICFVSLYAYPLFKPSVGTHFGGAEVQIVNLARALAKRDGFEVSVLVFDHQQPRCQTFGDVLVCSHQRYPAYVISEDKLTSRIAEFVAYSESYPGFRVTRWSLNLLYLLVRWVARRLSALAKRWLRRVRATFSVHFTKVKGRRFHRSAWKPLHDIDADIFCCRSSNELSAEIVGFCHQFKKRSVFFAASDMDFGERQQKRWFEGAGPFILRYANGLVVQTEWQAARLRELCGREPRIVRNPLPSRLTEKLPETPVKGPFALWVGKSDGNKQPEICLELARRCPDIPFVMVVNYRRALLHRSLLDNKPPNVVIFERLPFDRCEALFGQARVFVNTSRNEGFPNTFLQAGIKNVPVLSCRVDPDGYIREHQCGIVADGNFEKLVQGLKLIFHSPETAERFGRAHGKYVREFHATEERVDQIADVFRKLLES